MLYSFELAQTRRKSNRIVVVRARVAMLATTQTWDEDDGDDDAHKDDVLERQHACDNSKTDDSEHGDGQHAVLVMISLACWSYEPQIPGLFVSRESLWRSPMQATAKGCCRYRWFAACPHLMALTTEQSGDGSADDDNSV